MSDKELSTTEAQRKAMKTYDKKNPALRQYLNKKSATKSFIITLATEEDLELVQQWLTERLKKE